MRAQETLPRGELDRLLLDLQEWRLACMQHARQGHWSGNNQQANLPWGPPRAQIQAGRAYQDFRSIHL